MREQFVSRETDGRYRVDVSSSDRSHLFVHTDTFYGEERHRATWKGMGQVGGD